MSARSKPMAQAKALGAYRRQETEAEFQQKVANLALVNGFRLQYHTWSSRHSPKGFPDLVLVNEKAKRLIWVELKREGGVLTLEQLVWGNALIACGQEYYAWWPHNWETIVKVLR